MPTSSNNDPKGGCIKVAAFLQLGVGPGQEITTSLPLRVPVILTGPDDLHREERTDANGEFCFESLPVDQTYTITFQTTLDEDGDGFPEFRLLPSVNAASDSQQSEPGQFGVEIEEEGNCEDGPCKNVTVNYGIFHPESLTLDVIEDLRGIRYAVDDLANAARPVSGRPASPVKSELPTVAGGTGVQQFVTAAVSRILGTAVPSRPSLDDAKNILKALDTTITRTELPDGSIAYEWQPDVQIQPVAEDRILTGNQARLNRRAQCCLDETEALLDKIESLCHDADTDAVDAQKAIIRDLIQATVTEFGRSQGPSAFVVESMLASLQEEVKAFEIVLCYDVAEIDDLEDEKQRTYGFLLQDTVETLAEAWSDYQQGDPRLTLGLQLRGLKEGLMALLPVVQGTRKVLMDEGFGLDNMIPDDGLTVGDILDNIQQFAETEKQKLNHEANRRRVATILTLAEHLHTLAQRVSELTAPPFDQRYVRTAFTRIASALEAVITRAASIVNVEQSDEASSTDEQQPE